MRTRCIRPVAVVMAVTLTMATAAPAAAGAEKRPDWLMTPRGETVRVVMKKGEMFDAVWMGREGDRAIFERLRPDETISVAIESVRRVHARGARSSANSSAIARVGVAAGFWGGAILLGFLMGGR